VTVTQTIEELSRWQTSGQTNKQTNKVTNKQCWKQDHPRYDTLRGS